MITSLSTETLLEVRQLVVSGDLIGARAVLGKAAKTIVLRSGGKRRAASLDPIVARLRDGLQALIDEHMPAVKGGPLTLTDKAKALLLAAYQEAMRAGWDDSGAEDEGWDDADAEQAAEKHSSVLGDALVALGAALLTGSVSAAMADARMGIYAASLNPVYEHGFSSGVSTQGEVSQAEWHAEGDAETCELCDSRDGQIWQGDEEHPYPGDGGFGGPVCLGGWNCRCELWYTLVPASDVQTAATPDLTAMSVADLLALRSRLTED